MGIPSVFFLTMAKRHMSSDQNTGDLVYIWDYTTPLYRDYSKPIEGSPFSTQYNGIS